MLDEKVIIIGAGPAGLTAGYVLAKAGVPVLVLEADSQYVGGISYLWSRLFPVKNPRYFQEWVTNQFGRRLTRRTLSSPMGACSRRAATAC